MAEFNRNQFKGSTLNSIKDEQEKAEKAVPRMGNYADRPGFHTIVEGKNWRRIAPAISPDEPAYRAKSTVFLECEVPEIDDDGKETGKKSVKPKAIFIATQHSSVVKEDPILTYIEFVQKKANDEIQDKDARAKFLAPVNGYRDKATGKWVWGIKPNTEYICYSWDADGKLGRDQLYPYMLNAMKKLSVERSDDKAQIVPDIFTDPDNGFPLIIIKEKNEKNKWETRVTCDLPNMKENWQDFFLRTRISDVQLADLLAKESLTKLYCDVYTSRDFGMAIDGLRRFDDKFKFGIFNDPEFIEKLEAINATVPEYKAEATEDSAGDEPEPSSNEPISAAPPKVDPVTLRRENFIEPVAPAETASIPVPRMKRELAKYITENYGPDFQLPELDREGLEKWYMLSKAGEELPFPENVEQEAVAPEPPKQVIPPSPVVPPAAEVNPALAQQIANLRSKKPAGKK